MSYLLETDRECRGWDLVDGIFTPGEVRQILSPA